MRQRSYVKASSRSSSSYYSEKEKRGRKAVNAVFAVIALIAVIVAAVLFFKYRDIDLQREEAAGRLAVAKKRRKNLTTGAEQ